MTSTDCSASRHVFISVFTEFRRLYRKGRLISNKDIRGGDKWLGVGLEFRGGVRAPMVGKMKGFKYRCEAFVRDVYVRFLRFVLCFCQISLLFPRDIPSTVFQDTHKSYD